MIPPATIPATGTKAGAHLEVGFDLSQADRKTLGWPWIHITSPLAAGGGGALIAPGAGFFFSGRATGNLYWVGIDTRNLTPGDYDVWIIYGSGKAILVPIQILP